MQIVKHKSKSYTIPTSWNEVSTERYLKLVNMIKMFQDDEGKLTVDDEALFPRVVEVLADIKRTDVYNIEFTDVIRMKNNLSFLAKEPTNKFVKKDIFYFNQYMFKIKQFDKLTFGEYADSQHLKQVSQDNLVKSIANIVDIYERRNILKLKFRSKKLNLTIDEKEKIINSVPCTEFINLSFFLTSGQLKLLKNLRHSLEVMALRLNMKGVFQMTGVIISILWRSLVKTLQKSKKQSISTSEKP